jgi:hypothetical protein
MRRLIKVIAAAGVALLLSAISALTAFANQGPGPWP